MSLEEARAALLRVLERLDEAEHELGGPADRVDLVVAYAVGRHGDEDWHEVAGWSSTPGPKWVHGALLQRAADANLDAVLAVDDEEEE